jgi:hypothetical protein
MASPLARRNWYGTPARRGRSAARNAFPESPTSRSNPSRRNRHTAR